MAVSTFAFEHPPQAIVTGGAGGIGLGVARRLQDIGGSVVLADLAAAFDAQADDLSAFSCVPMDVRDETSIRAGVAAAVRELDGVDALVNAAGICRLGRIEEVSTGEWDEILGVNLRGTFLVMRELMGPLIGSGRGRIVNVASDAGKSGYPLLGAYCASKFGVVGLTQAVAAEVASAGVRVNAVCPSTIADTAMGRAVAEQRVALGQAPDSAALAAQRMARFPLGRPGTVADVTEAVLFLLSDSAGWITGESLNIDGGSLAG